MFNYFVSRELQNQVLLHKQFLFSRATLKLKGGAPLCSVAQVSFQAPPQMRGSLALALAVAAVTATVTAVVTAAMVSSASRTRVYSLKV